MTLASLSSRAAAHAAHAATALVVAAVLAAVVGPIGVIEATAGVQTTSAGVMAGSCAGDAVTVVVDFQELGGGVNVRCAPAPVDTGLAALDRAGISYQTAIRSPGFVCRIAGLPGDDPCHTASPTTAYWSYWVAGPGGNWCYSNFGAGSRTPPPGSFEGWSFSLHKPGRSTPPPRFAVPPPAAGSSPQPIPANHCTAPTEVTPPQAPVTSAPPSPPAEAPPVGPVAPGAGEPETGPGDPGTSAPPGAASSTTTTPTTAAGEGPTDGTGGAGGDTGSSDPSGSDGAAPEEAAAVDPDLRGTVDLGSDGGSSGSAAPLLATIGVVALVGGGAFLVSRRRRSGDLDPATVSGTGLSDVPPAGG